MYVTSQRCGIVHPCCTHGNWRWLSIVRRRALSLCALQPRLQVLRTLSDNGNAALPPRWHWHSTGSTFMRRRNPWPCHFPPSHSCSIQPVQEQRLQGCILPMPSGFRESYNFLMSYVQILSLHGGSLVSANNNAGRSEQLNRILTGSCKIYFLVLPRVAANSICLF